MLTRTAPAERPKEIEGPWRFSEADSPRSHPAPPELQEAAAAALRAVACFSRRMEDLARELNCLGYFDDEDAPRAA